LPGQVVAEVLCDREAAQDGVAELAAAQEPRRRHDPAHAERRPDLLGVPPAVRACADDLLQSDDVGIDRPERRHNAVGARAAVEATAAVNVVRGDAQRSRPGSHYAMIVARERTLALAGEARWHV